MGYRPRRTPSPYRPGPLKPPQGGSGQSQKAVPHHNEHTCQACNDPVYQAKLDGFVEKVPHHIDHPKPSSSVDKKVKLPHYANVPAPKESPTDPLRCACSFCAEHGLLTFVGQEHRTILEKRQAEGVSWQQEGWDEDPEFSSMRRDMVKSTTLANKLAQIEHLYKLLNKSAQERVYESLLAGKYDNQEREVRELIERLYWKSRPKTSDGIHPRFTDWGGSTKMSPESLKKYGGAGLWITYEEPEFQFGKFVGRFMIGLAGAWVIPYLEFYLPLLGKGCHEGRKRLSREYAAQYL